MVKDKQFWAGPKNNIDEFEVAETPQQFPGGRIKPPSPKPLDFFAQALRLSLRPRVLGMLSEENRIEASWKLPKESPGSLLAPNS